MCGHLAGNTACLDLNGTQSYTWRLLTWYVKPCTLVEIYTCFNIDILFYSKDSSSTFLQNTGTFLPNYIELHPGTAIFTVTTVRNLKHSYIIFWKSTNMFHVKTHLQAVCIAPWEAFCSSHRNITNISNSKHHSFRYNNHPLTKDELTEISGKYKNIWMDYLLLLVSGLFKMASRFN